MSPTVTILVLISAWLAVASAMLWGVLRINRRRQPVSKPKTAPQPHKQVVVA